MCSDRYENSEDKIIIAFCAYCKDAIYEEDDWICKNGLYYHFSQDDRLLNCFFLENEE